MIDNVKYSEKQIEIFNGIKSLIMKGTNPYAIKVSDIAQAAQVGKGTIYDYFSTKEEAISKAIIYNLNNEVKVVFNRILSKDSFQDRFYEVLECVAIGLKTNISTLNMLLSTGGVKEFYEYLVDDKYDLSLLMDIFNKEIDNLLKMGFDEGAISTNESRYYQVMALQGAVSGFAHYISGRMLCNKMDKKEAMDIAYKILIKALN